MNQKIKEQLQDALDIGLSSVMSQGWTRHQENDAQEIRDAMKALAELEAEKFIEQNRKAVEIVSDNLNELCDYPPIEAEKPEEDICRFEKSVLELSREPDKAYIYLGYIKKEHHAKKCAECIKQEVVLKAFSDRLDIFKYKKELLEHYGLFEVSLPDAESRPKCEEAEPLLYLPRSELQLNIMKSFESELLNKYPKSAFAYWWRHTYNWVKVQAFINMNTSKAGSTSSSEQCRFVGADPDSTSFLFNTKIKSEDK